MTKRYYQNNSFILTQRFGQLFGELTSILSYERKFSITHSISPLFLSRENTKLEKRSGTKRDWRKILPFQGARRNRDWRIWLNTKLWPSCEAQSRQRKSDPDNQFCIVPIISMEKNPDVILGWLFLLHFLNKYLSISLLYTSCQIRNMGSKQQKEIVILPTSAGLLSHKTDPCMVENGLPVLCLACHRIHTDGEVAS